MTTPTLSVPLRFVAREAPTRRDEPVTVGLPWPRGAVADDRHIRLVGPDGSPRVLQTKVLDRWPDGSVRWCLFDFLATLDGPADGYRIEVGGPRPGAAPLRVEHDHGDVHVETGARRFTVGGGDFPLTGTDTQASSNDRYWTENFHARRTELLDAGPVRVRVRADGESAGHIVGPHYTDCAFRADLDFFAGSSVVRVRLTVRNTLKASHPGGNWDLGAVSSVTFRDLTVVVPFDMDEFRNRPGGEDPEGMDFGPAPPDATATVRCSPERGQPFRDCPLRAEVYQDSSGGENWRSTNHVTAEREVPTRFRGYKLTDDDRMTKGDRATPVVTVERGGRFLGVAVPHFWENFPQAVEADARGLLVRLFPRQAAAGQELQGGEQKTFEFYLAFGPDGVTAEPLVWCRSPLLCHADPEWYASTGAIPYLTPKAADPNPGYLALADQAIDGPDTFFRKREVLDEYGWRHFGDVYGDHEAVFHKGPAPLVSHYNNQYDVVAGCAYQFLRSADPRWWDLLVPCADHTCDIDVYHTDRDKAAYNGGLFWHTYHYADADTATHRSYPRSLRQSTPSSQTDRMDRLGETAAALKKAYAVGGGPAASHNYNHGLMLAHFLTGNPLYRETAVGLARFVIDMDDPARTPFRFLSREFTGLATESGGGGYHGPGRASGNSVNALLVGHQLTGEAKYMEKAEQIIRRVAHPRQDLESLDLLNAELRWFYTMFLQAIGRYLDHKAELGRLDRMYAYARLTLLHYARWMAANERPILDTPDRLQYPTETWAAQDMRKVEVFQFAAKHAAGEERARFLERAEWFFRYVERTLAGFPTRSLCRPVVLMLNFGWSRAWWQRHPDAAAPEPAVAASPDEFGPWRMFVPQKAIALRRAKAILAAAGVFGMVGVAGLIWWAW